MHAPRFTLTELLLATTLIALGIGGLCAVHREPLVGYALWGDPTEYGRQFLLFGSATAIGAGVGAIFHHKLIGAAVGFVTPFACSAVWLVMNRVW